MNYKQLIDKWNAEADLYNQWDCLSEEEKVEFALVTAATAAAKSAIPTEQVKRGIARPAQPPLPYQLSRIPC